MKISVQGKRLNIFRARGRELKEDYELNISLKVYRYC